MVSLVLPRSQPSVRIHCFPRPHNSLLPSFAACQVGSCTRISPSSTSRLEATQEDPHSWRFRRRSFYGNVLCKLNGRRFSSRRRVASMLHIGAWFYTFISKIGGLHSYSAAVVCRLLHVICHADYPDWRPSPRFACPSAYVCLKSRKWFTKKEKNCHWCNKTFISILNSDWITSEDVECYESGWVNVYWKPTIV